MATVPSASDFLHLSVDDRLRLVEDIWNSIAACPESLELTPAQRQELDARLAAYHRDPAAGSPWETVKQRIKAKG
ncbi:MAG: addiction module protein [Planctomycetes bacterium]|nr:addiction module protein [Planctomycetota bacterium]